MFTKVILILCSLSLFASALSPALSKNYFFVNPNNTLPYELYQTRNGIISHSVEPRDNASPVSRYTLINLSTKDASPIFSLIVLACQAAAPTFQHVHYHVQTDSLVYFCAFNSSLLFIDQSTYAVQTAIPLNSQTSWPVVKLSTDGMSVAILAMDNLYGANPKASALFKVDMQTKKLTTQILLDQNFANGEAVVAYASGKKGTYIATNRIQGTDLNTTVYSIITIGNNYQLTPITTFNLSNYQKKIITKLFSVGNFIVVNNGVDVYFLNQQGKTVQSASARLKLLSIYDKDALYHTAFTAQNGDSNLYIQFLDTSVGKYSAYDPAIVLAKLSDRLFTDMQIAYGNSTSRDLAFTIDDTKEFFKIWDLQTSKTIYTALVGYFDLMQTNTTYAIAQRTYSSIYIFDSKTNSLFSQVAIGRNNYFYNKDQQIISVVYPTVETGCRLKHVDLVSGVTWNTLDLNQIDPYCSSAVVNARITQGGNPEVALSFNDHYLIISEKYGQLTLPISKASVNVTNLNINLDDLSFYYLASDQAKSQVNASFYTFDSQSKTFRLQNTSLINSTPYNSKGFFNVNSTLSVALSSGKLFVLDKLNSPFYSLIQNGHNLATSFQDASQNQYVIVSPSEDGGAPYSGTRPVIFTIDAFSVSFPGVRLDTASGRATGSKSFALYDDMNQSVGLVRFYKFDTSRAAKSFASNLRPQLF